MNKKILTTLGIVLLALVIVGLFFGKKQSQKQDNIDQVQNDVEIKKENQQKQVNDQDKDDLVWYEIPELNIKFKVTPEMKENLVYKMIDDTAWFCDLGVVRFANNKSSISFSDLNNDDFLNNCSQGSIFKIGKNKLATNGGDVVCTIVSEISKEEVICFSGPQSPAVKELEYRKTIGRDVEHINATMIKQSVVVIK